VFVTGGEPVAGCEPIAALIVGESLSEIEERAGALGIWHPSVWSNFRASSAEADMALNDARQFIWRPGRGSSWSTSETWPGTVTR
jgi:hypothetical protein